MQPTSHHPGMNCSNSSEPQAMQAEAQTQAVIREQDRFMPIANVIRIMRRVLPVHAKISDDAKETIQECVSEYISFITGEANERCQREQRKTITAEDVLWAMSKLGFDDYIEPLSVYLSRYREFEGDQRGSIRGEPLTLMRHRHQMATAPMMANVMHQHAHPSAAHVTTPQQYAFFGENGMPDGYYSEQRTYEDGNGGVGGTSTPHTLSLMSNLDNHHDSPNSYSNCSVSDVIIKANERLISVWSKQNNRNVVFVSNWPVSSLAFSFGLFKFQATKKSSIEV